MVKHIVGGAVLGAVLVLLGGVFLGANVHVTTSVNDERSGTGKFVVHVDERGDGTTFTVVNTETGEARMFDESGATVMLPAPAEE